MDGVQDASPVEQFSAAMIASADDAIISLDLDGKVMTWNTGAERLYGYAAGEMVGTRLTRIVPLERQGELGTLIARVANGEGVQRIQTVRFRRDGSRLDIALTLSPVHDAEHRLIGILNVARDITEQRRAERSLRASDERFRGLLESDPNGVLLVDGAGRIVFANGQAAEIFGYDRDALLELSVEALVPDAARGVHRGRREAYLREPRMRHMGFGRELSGRRRDGTVFPVEIGLSSFESGGERFVTAVVADITIRKETEEALRRTNETLSAIVTGSPAATIGLDREGVVRLWNPAAERIFGWSESEMLGHGLEAVTPEAERAGAGEVVSRILAGESVSGIEVERIRRDGSPVQLLLYAAPQRDGAGEVVGVVGLLADITAQRRLEEELLQAQKMESIGRLAGGVAHDFNNILTAITGFSELLLLDLADGSPERDSVEAIRAAANRASSLTQQLLAFSRRQVLQPRVLDMSEVLRSMEPMLRRLIGENIRLDVAARPLTGRILADPSQLEQVVLNLVVNARDAMPQGGRLLIEASQVDFDEGYAAEHFELAPGQYVMLAVSDTGVGMDRATRAHIFEPFFTTKEHGKGTGLGLATIYGIVRQSGGRIWLYSEPGRGSTFKVYFPVSAEVPVPELPSRTPILGGNETILLVEDEDAVRDIARTVLLRAGYRVLAARDADEGLSLEAELAGPLDLLVTDVVMPGQSGPQLASRLKARRPGLRALFLSGYTEEMIGDRGVPADDGFLGKPFTPDALSRKVREVLATGVREAPSPEA